MSTEFVCRILKAKDNEMHRLKLFSIALLKMDNNLTMPKPNVSKVGTHSNLKC